MDRAATGVGPGPGEHDIAALAGRNIAGVGRELRCIDKGVVDEFLIIGEVNDAALADDNPRWREQLASLSAEDATI